MKRILNLIFIFLLAFSLLACTPGEIGNTGETDETGNNG